MFHVKHFGRSLQKKLLFHIAFFSESEQRQKEEARTGG